MWRGLRSRTVVVGADLEGLLSAHEHADLAALLVLQELDITHAPLLPFAALLGEAEQLGATAERSEEGAKVRRGGGQKMYPMERCVPLRARSSELRTP
jgi:hypothetical protein